MARLLHHSSLRGGGGRLAPPAAAAVAGVGGRAGAGAVLWRLRRKLHGGRWETTLQGSLGWGGRGGLPIARTRARPPPPLLNGSVAWGHNNWVNSNIPNVLAARHEP